MHRKNEPVKFSELPSVTLQKKGPGYSINDYIGRVHVVEEAVEETEGFRIIKSSYTVLLDSKGERICNFGVLEREKMLPHEGKVRKIRGRYVDEIKVTIPQIIYD